MLLALLGAVAFLGGDASAAERPEGATVARRVEAPALVRDPRHAMGRARVAAREATRCERVLRRYERVPTAVVTRPSATIRRACAPTERWLVRQWRTSAMDREEYLAHLRIWQVARWSSHAVLRNDAALMDDLALRGLLGQRLAGVEDAITRTRGWLSTRPAPASGARQVFADSPLIYQWFPRHGWHVHPLANLTRLSAMLSVPDPPLDEIEPWAREMIRRTTVRRGGRVWEYLPPWSTRHGAWGSAMAQGTGLRVLARLWQLTGRDAYRRLGRETLPLFEQASPTGARAPGSDHYLLYTDDPDLLVGNAFAQTLLGLHEFAVVTGDRTAWRLLRAGERQLRRDLRAYDLDGWSRYALGRPWATVSYHDLFTDLVGDLCERLSDPSRVVLGDARPRIGTRLIGGPYCAQERRWRTSRDAVPRIDVTMRTSPVTRRGARGGHLVVRARMRGPGRLTVSLWDDEFHPRAGRVLYRGPSIARVQQWTLPRPVRGRTWRVKVQAASATGREALREIKVAIPTRPRRR